MESAKLLFRQCLSDGGRERKGKSTEYVSVALNTYQCEQHTVLHTLEKGNTYP